MNVGDKISLYPGDVCDYTGAMSKTLYIIDGHAQIYAAYYAPMGSNLTAPGGEPTKATYIFTTMLLKLIHERKPDMLVVAMDAPGPSFRHEMYEAYKANRQAMPEDLPAQIDRIDTILAAMNIPVIRLPGYEADDIIGTLTTRADQEGYQAWVCSKDKDLEQLITAGVKMYDPRKDEETDAASLEQAKGIRPDQVVDVLALAGDTSDNVPGVPMVGPGVAAKWIQEYGSLEVLLARKDEIKGKRGESLRSNLDQLELSRQLVTIDRNVPMEIDWDRFGMKPWDKERLAGIFSELGFSRLLDQYNLRDVAPVPSAGGTLFDEGPAAAPVAETNYTLVNTPEGFAAFMQVLEQQNHFAVDTETTGLDAMAVELVGMSFAWQPGEAYYLAFMTPFGEQHLDRAQTLEALRPTLESETIKKTGQNIKYDQIVLRQAGIQLAGVEFDTMLASFLLDSERAHNMDAMARDFLGHETIKLDSLIGKGKKQITFDQVEPTLARDYAAEDADITLRLRQYLEARLTDPDLRRLFDQVEMPLVAVLAEMEHNGIALDTATLRSLNGQVADRLEELTRAIHGHAGCSFNIDSPKQLGEVLFGKLGLPTGKKTQTGYSTDQSVLEGLQGRHPIIDDILEYRQLSKLKNTYIDKLPTMINSRTGRIHCSFNQTGAATGRLSSSDPNLQNIPVRTELGRAIRKAFVPGDKDHVLLAADYSQIELRMLAHLSGDEKLLAAFRSGADIHRFVASQVYNVAPDEVTSDQRSKAKAVNFGIIYGQTAFGLSKGIGISQGEAQQFIDSYFERYPGIRGFMDGVIAETARTGYVKTILGRQRPIRDITSRNFSQRKLAERMAVNTAVQGSAADLIKLAMIDLHRRIKAGKLPYQLLLQVHDELVLEAPRDEVEPARQLVIEAMSGAMQLEVPIVVDTGVGENWLECK